MKNKKIVCIDSDGCAMDTMNYKHIHCFGPIASEIFEVEDKQKFLKLWNIVNLYSNTRGVNRFIGLYMTFDRINKPLNEVKKWARNATELSNDSLKKYLEKNNSYELQKALLWSIKVNEKIEEIKHMAKPFSSVLKVIKELKKYVDVAIVSSANNEAIKDEWTKFGLINYVDYVMGQNEGSKKDCIKKLIDMGYNNHNIIMIGDSPGDINASKDNSTLMYPIIITKENESWDNFLNSVLPKFLNDEYEDSEFIEEYNKKLGELDAKIS